MFFFSIKLCKRLFQQRGDVLRPEVLEGFEQHQKDDQRRFACGVLLGQETLIKGRHIQLTLRRCCLELPIGGLVDSWHDGSFLTLTTFPGARFAFGCFTIIGDVALQAA